MINTNSQDNLDGKLSNYTFESADSKYNNISAISQALKIRVTQKEGNVVSKDNSWEVSAPTEKGKAPQMFVAPQGWVWPVEREDIRVAYRNFQNWTTEVNATDWYKTLISEDVIYNPTRRR